MNEDWSYNQGANNVFPVGAVYNGYGYGGDMYNNVMGSVNNFPGQMGYDQGSPYGVNQPSQRMSGGYLNNVSSATDRLPSTADWWQKDASPFLPPTRAFVSPKDSSDQYDYEYSESYEEEENEKPSVKNFDPTSIGNLQKQQKSQPKFIAKDKMSPRLWTYGFTLIVMVTFGAAMYTKRSFLPIMENPLYGPDAITLITFGAKYGPLINDGQWWRFGTALLMHGGVIQVGIVFFIMTTMGSIEQKNGFWQASLSFLLAGLYGYILSSMFVPNTISCGANGAVFGWLGMKLSDLVASWSKDKKACSKLTLLLFQIILLIAMGFVPYNDNFCNAGGFTMGFLLALTMLPNVGFNGCELYCRMGVAFLAFPAMTTLFCLCLVLYYRRVSVAGWCTWCQSLTCINFTFAQWCPTI